MDEPISRPGASGSFEAGAEAYDRARPTYPAEAAKWLVERAQARVLELGAGTGKLTEQLIALGHTVVASEPSEPMLRRLSQRLPQAHAVLAAAERLPAASRSVDAVVAAQSFHWFDQDRMLPEAARVLRSRGTLGLVWNVRDERVPWVRRLGTIIAESSLDAPDPRQSLDDSGLFETVQRATFRFWQPMTRVSLRELVLSRSAVAMMPPAEQEPLLAKVDELYDGYGRGHDGMLLPYLTHAYRAVVLPWAAREPETRTTGSSAGVSPGQPAEPDALGTDFLLVDFR
ncbi:MAG: class I SAM-dependent methyltransferase [Actinomycetota bacterium]|nr:class I SAM-dependent methyltransferase [Actinomycetota bacterium]